ncbi:MULTISPECIES: HAD family hydrolase [Arthrobacter]|uniref:HAD family phosphatase n=1 Tax=Arthrobacter terricola TaxID=2547396 RepID=A0A4R5KEF7_9MICC|nr:MULTISPECIES: HAD family hydrolase [Arthrobacter]MBT8162407.1 Cof-type HAD-IIB family hydrolase [Arthrobacter sp. GN70]TDF93342.1 HAD family phosphatase [Arthrobacter terricola]
MSSTPETSNNVRAVFLDVDGTYADYGVVPTGHVKAVQAARRAGHRVLLCTGRPVSMLPPSIQAAGFDGVVASVGAYVQVAGTVLVDRRFHPDLAARTIRVLDAHDAVYILEAQDESHAPPAAFDRLRTILDVHFSKAPGGPVGASDILNAVRSTRDRGAARFAKVSVFDSPIPMPSLAGEIGGEIAVVANSVADEGRHAGELYQRGISKADGIAAVMAHLGIARENTVAIGDGANDLEMIAFAGVGIAIEGSLPELVAVADRTTPGPREEGLVAAFAGLGII